MRITTLNKIVEAKLPNLRWEIREDRTKEHGLYLIEVNSNNTLLNVDITKIPKNMSIIEFIESLQKEGIIYTRKPIKEE